MKKEKSLLADQKFSEIVEEISNESRFLSTRQFIQHGDVSVYQHCLNVAYISMKLSYKLGMRSHQKELIRGALLHDYFLYDWHIQDGTHRLHGFHHPKRALMNALDDFSLTNIEQEIIAKHMFPLTIRPPKCKEAIIVCLVDKFCCVAETMGKQRFYSMG